MALAAKPTLVTSTVYPSGRACAVRPAENTVPAMFSTTTDWPRSLPMPSATSREIMSVGPPAEPPAISVTGRAGKSARPSWACAPRGGGATPASSAGIDSRIVRRVGAIPCSSLKAGPSSGPGP